MVPNKKQTPDDLIVPLSIAVAQEKTQSGVKEVSEQSESNLEKLLGVLLQEKTKQLGLEEKQRQNLIEFQKQTALTQQKMIENQAYLQDHVCNHRKPNNQPNLGGQRNHQRTWVIVCQGCRKTWDNIEEPQRLGLVPDMEIFGGPIH